MDFTLITNGFVDSLLLAATEAKPDALATVWWALALLSTIAKVGLGLGFVIFVHELGHFLVAKACGVKCDKFYIGFDVPISIGPIHLPAKLFHFQYGETEYGIGIIPLGGYVKMLGQDDDPRNAQAEAERTMIRAKDAETEGEESIQSITNALAETAMNPPEHPEMKLDPRSFPAKSVPARMAIISAGVIMNLIFAVILGAVAFMMGVPYQPAIIGYTVNGSPAWIAGMQPGDQIIQVGKNSEPNEHLRFIDDLVRPVFFGGAREPMSFLVRHADGQEEWFEIQPVLRDRGGKKTPTIGVVAMNSLKLNQYPEKVAYMNAQASEPLQAGDKIVKVNGQDVTVWPQVQEILAQKPNEPLELTIERPASKDAPSGTASTTLNTTIAPRPTRTLGLAMKSGEIAAIRKGTPADKAGLKAGDRIVQIDGVDLGDPLTLAQRLLPKSGQEVKLTVQRGGKTDSEEIPVVLETPKVFDSGATYMTGDPVGLPALGVALRVTSEVAAVLPGSPAEKAGLQAGDQLVDADTLNPDPEVDAFERKEITAIKEKYVFGDEGKTWQSFAMIIQALQNDSKVKLTFRRGDKTETVEMLPVADENHFQPQRGLSFAAQGEIRQATGIGEALQLGARETKERMGEVLLTLASLGTGRISVGDLGGPLSIFAVAGMQAQVGISSLLMFLVLLSANLAIINFLPIPALDGGHMMFLTAEWLRGKPVDPELQMKLTIGGVLCLLSLMAFVTVMDVGKLITLFS